MIFVGCCRSRGIGGAAPDGMLELAVSARLGPRERPHPTQKLALESTVVRQFGQIFASGTFSGIAWVLLSPVFTGGFHNHILNLLREIRKAFEEYILDGDPRRDRGARQRIWRANLESALHLRHVIRLYLFAVGRAGNVLPGGPLLQAVGIDDLNDIRCEVA